jgi:hypothetical protein
MINSPYDLFVQSVAIVAFILFAVSFHAKTRRNILVVNTISLFAWLIHFSLLQAWTGVTLCGINFVISTFLIFKEKHPWIGGKIFTVSSIGLLVLGAIITWNGFFSAFALAGIISVVIAKLQSRTNVLRSIMILGSLFWIAYDYFVGSYGGMLSEALIIVSIAWSLFRNRARKSD